MSDYVRLLQTDVTLFTGSPTSMNSITNSLYYQSLYFIYFLHVRSRIALGAINPAVALVYNVLIKGSVKFFAVKWVLKGRKWLPVSRIISEYLSVYVRFLYPFASVSMSLPIYYQLYSLYFIVRDWRFYLLTFPYGLLSLAAIELNLIFNYLQYCTFAVVNFNVSMLTLAFTLTVFSQLSSINRRYLQLPLKRRSKSSHGVHLLRTFMSYHSQTVVLILLSSAYFGHLLSAFIAIYLPFSTKITVMLFFTDNKAVLAPVSAFALVVIFAFQCVGIFGFHILASMHSSRIHGCSKRLFHWVAMQQQSMTGKRSVQCKLPNNDLLKLHLYICKFHVPCKGKYGLNYLGGIAGVMSVSSFGKFLLFYSENLLFSYQLSTGSKKS